MPIVKGVQDIVLHSEIVQHLDALRDLCGQEQISQCIIFGSATRADFRPDVSDVDIVVTFEPGQKVSAFRLSRLAHTMSTIMGHPVDLHTWTEIHPKIQSTIKQNGVTIFERQAG